MKDCHLKRTVSNVCTEKIDKWVRRNQFRIREMPGALEILNTSEHERESELWLACSMSCRPMH